ncbi:MAG: selenium cofactor biosynthesis protein YqeC [Zhaonellaceae bacterium]
MNLVQALQAESYKVITVIGGGGKTSTLLTLAKELRLKQKNFFITTTTKMAARELAAFPIVYGEHFDICFLKKLGKPYQKQSCIGLATRLNSSGKILGIPAQWIDILTSLYPDFYFLVEGDGAAQKPFKIPGEHEPVIPSSTRLVVGIIGAEIIGQRLTESNVHRAQLMSQLFNVPLGKELSLNVIADVLTSQYGYLKNVPASCDFAIIINKVESKVNYENGEKLAHFLLERGMVRVILTALQTDRPVREVFYL